MVGNKLVDMNDMIKRRKRQHIHQRCFQQAPRICTAFAGATGCGYEDIKHTDVVSNVSQHAQACCTAGMQEDIGERSCEAAVGLAPRLQGMRQAGAGLGGQTAYASDGAS